MPGREAKQDGNFSQINNRYIRAHLKGTSSPKYLQLQPCCWLLVMPSENLQKNNSCVWRLCMTSIKGAHSANRNILIQVYMLSNNFTSWILMLHVVFGKIFPSLFKKKNKRSFQTNFKNDFILALKSPQENLEKPTVIR